MTISSRGFSAIAAIPVILAVLFFSAGRGNAEEGKVLSLENVKITCYALGGDAGDKKAFEEAMYLTKGGPNDALSNLKDIVIEGKKPVWSFKMKDKIEVVIFRGTFLKLSKIEIKKVVLKGPIIEILAEYPDFPDSDISSQPAAVVPIGQLLPGKYTIRLFVENKLRKEAAFSVSR